MRPWMEHARRFLHSSSSCVSARRPKTALAGYEDLGRRTREEILAALPDAWSFAGKRVLDFGCGAGRTLRHFLAEAESAEIYGCDIDPPSVAWLEANLSPPLRVFRNDELPPLPLEDESLDLVWAISVFTHLADNWAGWLLELHRLLRAEGLLLATFHGPALSEKWAKTSPNLRPEPIGSADGADRVGMNVLHYGRSWDLGGPAVFHSGWWLEEHWGRGFEILSLREEGFASPQRKGGQGVVVLRKRAVELTVEELERLDPAEAREVEALRHNLRQLHNESRKAREAVTWLEAERASRFGLFRRRR